MTTVQIVGATGYGGVGLVELLVGRSDIEIVSLLATSEVNKPLSAIYPHLRGFCDRIVEEADPDRIGEGADLVIFSTPDRVAMTHAVRLIDQGKRILDFSGDFRFTNPSLYEGYAKAHPGVAGKPHLAPDLIARSVYGIPEIFRDEIREANIVGNPGCFAVAMILSLLPAAKAGVIDLRTIIVDGKTGVSGGGKQPTHRSHFPNSNEGVTPYRIARHQHVFETVATLEAMTGEKVAVTFVPHLVPLTRGIIVTCYVRARGLTSLQEMQSIYEKFYSGEPFVRVLPPEITPGPKAVSGSNICDISLAFDAANECFIIVGSIDNLMKGQAGVALQNINIMLGLPDTLGLDHPPRYP